eukprot:GGOE01021991.1.p1 GENE.GGOE01021991.1~~GGOE01021991.1.p1  ORF type:complete len:1125 (+),score=259.48 GGOE01021991.1:45-3419(+)
MPKRRLPSPTPTSSTAQTPSTSVSSHHRPRRKAQRQCNGTSPHSDPHPASPLQQSRSPPRSPPLKTFAPRGDLPSGQPLQGPGAKPLKPKAPSKGHRDLREALDAERRRGQAGQDREQRLYARLKEIKRKEEEKNHQCNGNVVEDGPATPPLPAALEAALEMEMEAEVKAEAEVEHRHKRRHAGHRHHHRKHHLATQPGDSGVRQEDRPPPEQQGEDHASASAPLPAFQWARKAEAVLEREAGPAEVETSHPSRRRRGDGMQMGSREKVEAWLRGTPGAGLPLEEVPAKDVPDSSSALPHGQLLAWAHLSVSLPGGDLPQDDAEDMPKGCGGGGREMQDRSHRSPAVDRDGHRHSSPHPTPPLLVEPNTFTRSKGSSQRPRVHTESHPPPADSLHRHRPPSPSPHPLSTTSQRQADGKADRARDAGSSRCFNCGSFTHGTRQCEHPIICAYCCFPGHTFRTCDERRLDERSGKPMPTDDALLEWCRRSHEVAEGPKPPMQHPCNGRHGDRGREQTSRIPADSKAPLAAPTKGELKSQPPACVQAHSPSSIQPDHDSGRSSASSDINAVMARTVARMEQRKKGHKESERKRKRSRSPKKSKKKKRGKRSRGRSPPEPSPPHAVATPPNEPTAPPVDIRAQLKEQLQRIQPEKQLQLIQEQIRQRQQQMGAAASASEQGLSLNAILNGPLGSGKEEESADDDDLNAWLRDCAGPTRTSTKPSAAAQPNGRPQGKATPVVSRPDTYDIFADTDAVPQLPMNGDDASHPMQAEDTKDAEGYYLPRVGELLDGRFRVQGVLGKGVFGVVVSATDVAAVQSPEGDKAEAAQVAIKIARSNPVMEAAAKKEVATIQSLDNELPQERSKCVSILATFHHQQHYCIVMELLSLNLREFLKKYGTEEGVPVGLHLDAVRLYARDIFQALNCLERSGIFHGDVKPDNILVNQRLKGVRLCDFGTACKMDECTPTPYVCSRYYRAPEIILGLGYGHAADMWAAACTVYELYTGQILFKGETNNEMLKLFMALKGRFANKLVKAAQFGTRHFDENFAFLHASQDPVTKKTVVKKVTNLLPLVDLKALLRIDLCRAMDEKQRVLELADLLDRILQLDPSARITAEEALQHPFVVGRRA